MEVEDDQNTFGSDDESETITFNKRTPQQPVVEDQQETSSDSESEAEIQEARSEDEKPEEESEDEIEEGEIDRSNQNNFSKEEIIDEAVAKFQDVFMKSGFIETMSLMKQQLENNNKEKEKNKVIPVRENEASHKNRRMRNDQPPKQGNLRTLDKLMSQASMSELTIYRNAVENHINKRNSSSSEEDEKIVADEGMEISDESKESNEFNNSLIDEFIAEARERTVSRNSSGHESRRDDDDRRSYMSHQSRREVFERNGRNSPQPGPSRERDNRPRQRRPTTGEVVNRHIREAEQSMDHPQDLPGEFSDFHLIGQQPLQFKDFDIKHEYVHSSMVDQSY